MRQPWVVLAQKYEKLHKIGQGSFGVVFKGRCLKTGNDVAIKYIQLPTDNTTDNLKHVLSEVIMLRKLQERPENIYTTKLLDLLVPEVNENEPVSWVILILEYLPNDLRVMLNNSRDMGVTEKHVVAIMFNLLSALSVIHSAGLMHRDVKPGNFLISGDCRIKVCDFGSCRPILSE